MASKRAHLLTGLYARLRADGTESAPPAPESPPTSPAAPPPERSVEAPPSSAPRTTRSRAETGRAQLEVMGVPPVFFETMQARALELRDFSRISGGNLCLSLRGTTTTEKSHPQIAKLVLLQEPPDATDEALPEGLYALSQLTPEVCQEILNRVFWDLALNNRALRSITPVCARIWAERPEEQKLGRSPTGNFLRAPAQKTATRVAAGRQRRPRRAYPGSDPNGGPTG